MPPELQPFLEYGPVGIVLGVLYLVARMYLPHYQAMVAALVALPEGMQSLSASIVHVREELAVIKDRLPMRREEPQREDRLSIRREEPQWDDRPPKQHDVIPLRQMPSPGD